MTHDLIFSLAGLISFAGWLTLLASPFIPRASDLIAGTLSPLALSLGYIACAVLMPADAGGGFGSFADVTQLFSSPNALLAGWVHFLAFDLFVGAWICRTARAESIPFWLVLPCLPITFLLGPAGFALFTLIRTARHRFVPG